MKLTLLQRQSLIEKVFNLWKANENVTFKVDEKKCMERALAALAEELQKEEAIEAEAHKMVEQLERQHGDGFQRHKMFQLIKAKLAKDKKVIL